MMMMMMMMMRKRRRSSSRTRRSRGAQGEVPWTTAIMTLKIVRRPRPKPLMTTRRIIQLISSKYYHLLVQRRLRQKYKILEFYARILSQKRICGSSLIRSFMPWTTRTGSDGSREGCMGAAACACSHAQFPVRYSKS